MLSVCAAPDRPPKETIKSDSAQAARLVRIGDAAVRAMPFVISSRPTVRQEHSGREPIRRSSSFASMENRMR